MRAASSSRFRLHSNALSDDGPPLQGDEVEIVFRAKVTVRNPADIDGYIAIIQSP